LPEKDGPDPAAGADDSRRPPAEPELDELPEGLPVVVELDEPATATPDTTRPAAELDELPSPEDDRDPDPDNLHPFAARFNSRGLARGHVCPSCSTPTTPVEPGHTYCGRCGSHWTLDRDQA
jgi:hypothetical protein